MIRIEYLENKHSARIVTDDENHISWHELCRSCKENGEDVSFDTAKTITMPWWSFLSIRPSINRIRKSIKLVLLLMKRQKSY